MRLVRSSLILAFLLTASVQAQLVENDMELRSGIELSYELSKQIRFELEPELRWSEQPELDEYHLNLGGRYKPADLVAFYAQYRLIGERKKDQANAYLSRYKFAVGISDKIQRWDPAFRLSFTNYADDEEVNGRFFQYTASLAYDIRGLKLTPELNFNIYQNLSMFDISKYRTKLDLRYKITGDIRLEASYALDYFMLRALNRHIISLSLLLELD